MKYNENKPYPIPRVESPNKEYAKLLLNDYAGHISEDTAIHLYLYQHLILEEQYPEIAKILEGIARSEMIHLELLGKTITLLGVKPFFGTIRNNGNINYFTSEYVNYNTNLKDIIEIDIDSEEEAIRNYKKNINEIDDKYIRELLARIIEDEIIHLNIFRTILSKIS